MTEAGLLTVFMQGPSLLQPFIGHLADRISLRTFVILAPAVTATMMSLLGVAPGYAVLALFLVAVGFSSASLHAVGPVIAGNLSGRSLGRGMGFRPSSTFCSKTYRGALRTLVGGSPGGGRCRVWGRF
jgi:FSR family fosmidomycin resistance protein-like MFS transporter